jgi:hypothetical protein
MFRYKLKKKSDGEVTHQKEISDDVANPWQDDFDKQGGSFQGIPFADYEIEKEDMAAEEAVEAAKQQSKQDAMSRMAAKKGLITPADAPAILEDILEYLGIGE